MRSNIEAVARAICARALGNQCSSASELAADVDRFWHCIAAKIEAGLLDDEGDELGPYDHDKELAAYRDYVQRHQSN